MFTSFNNSNCDINNDYSIDSTDKEAIETVLSMLKEKDEEIEYQKEKRNNQKAELAILNEKQKEMNKLINIVSSYKGMFKKQQKEMKKKDKQIDLMANFINDNTPHTKDTKELENEEGIRTSR